MPDPDHHWITLHRIRFPEPVSALERKFEPPQDAECWRFAPDLALADNGLPAWNSDVWCGMALHGDRQSAERLMADPVPALPYFAEAVEQWHALAVPFAHRGEVNWRGSVEENSAVSVAADPPEGLLAVITTAGFDSREPDQIPRIARFMRKIEKVLEAYGTDPGNLRRAVFAGGFDGRDGFTLSLWKSDPGMIAAAYKPGTHRTYMDESRDGSLFDRSSFTRARIVASKGSWDGDPVAEAA